MTAIEVLDGGLLTTVQDLGRWGYQRYGVPVSGALDGFALRVANRLVGNDDNAAGLEITLIGPRLRLLTTTVVALAGADLEPRLDDQEMPMWTPTAVAPGATLSFGTARDGVRAYLAVAGGLDVPLVLGSRSTHVRSKLGGLNGDPLKAGDRLSLLAHDPPTRIEGRRCPPDLKRTYGHHHIVRVVLGPQDDAFTEAGVRTFLSSTYAVTPHADRIGCRLQGPAIEHRTGPDVVSDGIPCGAVQVAGDGQPMVLLADRGTTGGYTKIATVISVDVPRLAQAATGDTVQFVQVSVAEAQEQLAAEQADLARISAGPPVVFARRRFRVTVSGVPCEVETDLAEVRVPAGVTGTRLLHLTAEGQGGRHAFAADVVETDSVKR